ncbi:MAG TPA: DNA-binding protein [Clostridiaceae bacterium]|nr:DNA-binding protein [Clostridiaceae bacterium]
MKYKQIQQTYFLRVDPGEDVVTVLLDFAKEEDIQVADITGIGAVNEVTLGVFDTETKIYHSQDLIGTFEITSLIGSLTRKNDAPYLHAHMNIAGLDNKTYGGHLNRAIVSATAEIVVRTVEGQIGRRFDEEIGLNLFDF